MEEKLIESIRKRSIIFDFKSGDYKNIKLKNLKWKEIANEVGISVEDAKNKWKNLRDSFVRIIRATNKKSEQEAEEQTQWKYYDQLLFLKDHIQYKPTSSNHKKIKPAQSPEMFNFQISYTDTDDTEPRRCSISYPNFPSTSLDEVTAFSNTSEDKEVTEAEEAEKNVIRNLISLVHKNKCLYDKRDSMYFNKAVKDKIWNEIGTQVGKSGQTCKAKWKLLREKYNKELKKRELLKGSIFESEEGWAYFNELMFLKESIKRRKTSTNELEPAQLKIETLADETSFEENWEFISPENLMKSERFEKLCDKFAGTLDKFETNNLCAENEENPDELFMRTVIALIKDLPVSLKDEFRQEVFTKLMNLRRQHLH